MYQKIFMNRLLKGKNVIRSGNESGKNTAQCVNRPKKGRKRKYV